jgi:uncharacterized protein (TIGR00369 family)
MSALDPLAMSGLELIQAAAEGKLPIATMAETIPMRIVEVSRGRVRFTARADKRHLNPLGGVHGGFAATVLDSVTGCAVHTTLEVGVGYGTVDLNVKLLRPVPIDTELVAEGTVIHVSRSLGVAEGSLRDASGTLYAHATCTCAIIRRSSPKAP